MKSHYSLYELHQYIRQTIALNFDEPIWIEAEIAQVSFSGRHAYLDLWQKDENTDQVTAQASAVIWADKLSFIKRKSGDLFHDLMMPGVSVLIKVKPDFHERYGLKLVISDIDPSFTLGRLAMQKELTIKKLEAAGHMTRNAEIEIAPVLKRIALLSSSTSAGLQDFYQQIEDNEMGYAYDLDLYAMSVQGVMVAEDMRHHMNDIHTQSDIQYDLIILMRGGGSKMDLAAFDEYDVAELIALSDIPVLTAIGHERDQSIADMVSAISVKTPTAAADYLLRHTENYEQGLIDDYHQIAEIAYWHLSEQHQALNIAANQLKAITDYRIRTEKTTLENVADMLTTSIDRYLGEASRQLDDLERTLKDRDPETLLRRGYSITSKGGRMVSSVIDLVAGDHITTTLADGSVSSIITDS